RGRGSHGARAASVPENARRASAGGCHPAPRGRFLLRSAGTARGIIPRGGGTHRGHSGGKCHAGQCTRNGTDGKPRASRLPFRIVPPSARRGNGAALGGDLVVRPGEGTSLRAGASRQTGRQARVWSADAPAVVRRTPEPTGTHTTGRDDSRATSGLY